jgi:flagellar hook-basal body complex protein FliE
MNAGGIDTSQIEAMLAQLRAASARLGIDASKGVDPQVPIAGKLNFSDALKASLDQLNASQVSADQLGKKFVQGDNSVGLSDVMIAMQKASISFQATIQVRNKLVTAYHDIMNMQI